MLFEVIEPRRIIIPYPTQIIDDEVRELVNSLNIMDARAMMADESVLWL